MAESVENQTYPIVHREEQVGLIETTVPEIVVTQIDPEVHTEDQVEAVQNQETTVTPSQADEANLPDSTRQTKKEPPIIPDKIQKLFGFDIEGHRRIKVEPAVNSPELTQPFPWELDPTSTEFSRNTDRITVLEERCFALQAALKKTRAWDIYLTRMIDEAEEEFEKKRDEIAAYRDGLQYWDSYFGATQDQLMMQELTLIAQINMEETAEERQQFHDNITRRYRDAGIGRE